MLALSRDLLIVIFERTERYLDNIEAANNEADMFCIFNIVSSNVGNPFGIFMKDAMY